jgi:raffinose/stachyose/melibiose transport system permease protein
MNKVEAVSKNQITTVKRSFLDSDNAVNLMYIPAFILFIIFVLYPLIEGVRISFTDWNGFSQSYDYIGIKNYLYMLTDKNMLIAFINTLLYGFGSTFFQQILGLGYAILLNNYFKGRDFARTLIYLPVLIAPIIMGYMWYFLFQYSNGALNDVLKLFGMQPIDWLAKGNVAVWIIVLVNTLQFCGISMVIYLAGLQTIPKMYYEASEIDGANAWQQFLHITLPLLKPSIVTSITINLIGGLKLFDAIKALTNGGPGYASHSISTLLSYTYFNNQSAGYASAMGIILFIFIILISLLSQILFNRKEVDY